jgi:glycolate oxidase FAD binding subunit
MLTPFSRDIPDFQLVQPQSVAEAGDVIRAAASAGKAILARGGGSKWSMGALPPEGTDAIILDTRALRGIVAYDPAELTITVSAGTSLADLIAALAQHGQYLPFDPPFAGTSLNATVGGTVAAGFNGPRRLRYGGLRDFIIGIQYLDSEGTLVKSGGRVVKNAAGYDFAKLFCGSLGTLGILTQVSFKVFPRPAASVTLMAGISDAPALQAFFAAALRSTAEISAAEGYAARPNLPLGQIVSTRYLAAVQVEGSPESLAERLKVLRNLLPPGADVSQWGAAVVPGTTGGEAEEDHFWATLRDVDWAGDFDRNAAIVRLYLPPDRVAVLDGLLRARGVQAVYSLGGNAAWAAVPDAAQALGMLNAILAENGAQAAIWRTGMGYHGPEIIPAQPNHVMAQRVKDAFDPRHLFYPGRLVAL